MNIGLCRGCENCIQYSSIPVQGEEHANPSCFQSYVFCSLVEECFLGWDSDVPDGCVRVLEQVLTDDDIKDLIGGSI